MLNGSFEPFGVARAGATARGASLVSYLRDFVSRSTSSPASRVRLGPRGILRLAPGPQTNGTATKQIVPPLVLYSHIATTMNVPQVCFVKDATDERARDVLGFRGHHRAHCPARCAHRARRARLHVHSRRARPRDH